MKTVLFTYVLLAVVVSSCKRDDDKEPAPNRQQLLTKIRFAHSPQVFTEIDYVGDKINEIRDLTFPGIVTTYSSFAFDSKGAVVGFTTRTPNGNGFKSFKHEIFRAQDRLSAVEVTPIAGGDPKPNRIFLFEDFDDDSMIVTGHNETQAISYKVAIYDKAGNMTRLVKQVLPNGKRDTTDFSDYDNHPNTTGLLEQLRGVKDFYPPSKNNCGTVTNRRGALPPQITKFTFEYNAQGNPVKAFLPGDTMFLEYKEL
jgi:hypothetical protein